MSKIKISRKMKFQAFLMVDISIPIAIFNVLKIGQDSALQPSKSKTRAHTVTFPVLQASLFFFVFFLFFFFVF